MKASLLHRQRQIFKRKLAIPFPCVSVCWIYPERKKKGDGIKEAFEHLNSYLTNFAPNVHRTVGTKKLQGSHSFSIRKFSSVNTELYQKIMFIFPKILKRGKKVLMMSKHPMLANLGKNSSNLPLEITFCFHSYFIFWNIFVVFWCYWSEIMSSS